eukprot:3222508-Pyramimonas_sp.AAC.1
MRVRLATQEVRVQVAAKYQTPPTKQRLGPPAAPPCYDATIDRMEAFLDTLGGPGARHIQLRGQARAHAQNILGASYDEFVDKAWAELGQATGVEGPGLRGGAPRKYQMKPISQALFTKAHLCEQPQRCMGWVVNRLMELQTMLSNPDKYPRTTPTACWASSRTCR